MIINDKYVYDDYVNGEKLGELTLSKLVIWFMTLYANAKFI